jgi:hypothetical protein
MLITPVALVPDTQCGPALAPYTFSEDALTIAREQFDRFGFAVLGPDALEPSFFGELRSEAAQQRVRSCWPLRTGDGRSRVSEDNLRGHFGPLARSLMASESTASLMQAVTGEPILPSWSASCYTWYDQPGAWLGRHCDKKDACYLTMIVGIVSLWPAGTPPPPGNQLWIYCSFKDKQPLYRLTTIPNRITIVNGKKWPHERPKLGVGQDVCVLCGCFRNGAE